MKLVIASVLNLTTKPLVLSFEYEISVIQLEIDHYFALIIWLFVLSKRLPHVRHYIPSRMQLTLK